MSDRFEQSCHVIGEQPKACTTVFNWTALDNKVQQFTDVVDSVDPHAKVCFVDMQFNMKIHPNSGIAYNYNLGKAGLFPVSASCNAADRNELLLRVYKMLLQHTTRALPDAQISDVAAQWTDGSCGAPSYCHGKSDFSCYSPRGFCEADDDMFCPLDTVCSEVFHKRFPNKNPCVNKALSYGCDETTKKCVVDKGLESLADCVAKCK